MSKIYKGWESIKAIADSEIKNEAKIIPLCGFLKDYYKGGRRSDEDVNICVFLDNDRIFELIQDEIDIDSIEELEGIIEYSTERNTINQLIRAVKQIDKRVKELEKE